MSQETRGFEAEVSRLLDIVANALYSSREVFLRELISNASDACDKLRYMAIQDSSLLGDNAELKVTIVPNKEAGTLTIRDNGIGMDREDLISHLGSIGKSGTKAFIEALEAQKNDQSNLIGQFGVGFYSAFMVSDKVCVYSCKAGTREGYVWESDGKGQYTLDNSDVVERGTSITLHLKEDAKEFLENQRLEMLIKTYSDHVQVPVYLPQEKEEEAEEEGGAAFKQVNAASALWVRPKSELKKEDYEAFYKASAGMFDSPWDYEHFKAEGKIEYSGLIFIPSTKPFNLFEPDRKNSLKLYVRRVFITDDCQELLPPYLRFLRGVVDSSDLPLNVSRELLQSSPVLERIRDGLTNRILKKLTKRADKDAAAYTVFWENFGAVLKEGLYEDFNRRDDLLKLLRVKTTSDEGWTSLAEVKERIVDGQKALYFLAGDDADALAHSPHLEGYKARGIEVILLSDHVDSFWTSMVSEFDGLPFKSVTKGGEDLEAIKPQDAEEKPDVKEGDFAELIAHINTVLAENIKEARLSTRLTDSAAVLVADENDLDMGLARMLKATGQSMPAQKRILELNPNHPLVLKLNKGCEGRDDLIEILLDQALILEGEAPRDRIKFAQRLSANLM